MSVSRMSVADHQVGIRLTSSAQTDTGISFGFLINLLLSCPCCIYCHDICNMTIVVKICELDLAGTVHEFH